MPGMALKNCVLLMREDGHSAVVSVLVVLAVSTGTEGPAARMEGVAQGSPSVDAINSG